MTTLLNYKTTLEYLAYLGYRETPRTSALQITRPRKAERKKGKPTRNTYLCYVCGAAGSGKTSLLRAFVGRKFSKDYEPTKRINSVVNTVAIEGREINLVVSISGHLLCSALSLILPSSMYQLQEFGSRYEAETLRSSKKTDLADVIVYVHDSSDTNSFSYISNLRVCFPLNVGGIVLTAYQQQYSLDHIPTLFVATKSDLDLAHQVRYNLLGPRGSTDSSLFSGMKYNRTCTAEDWVCKCP